MVTSTEVSFGLEKNQISKSWFNIEFGWLFYFRSIIVFASVVSGGFFLHDNTSEFLKSTVQTTLDSMVPLSQVSRTKIFFFSDKMKLFHIFSTLSIIQIITLLSALTNLKYWTQVLLPGALDVIASCRSLKV